MRFRAAVYAVAVLGALCAGCGGGAAPATVPSLGGGGSGHGGSSRSAELHAAAQCVRQHGVPGYADPVLTPSGVYSDSRSFENASQAALSEVRSACGTLMARAGLNPVHEPPAPPQLVQAGVHSAACARAHGLPNMKDPSARTPYTPGHGFSLSPDEIPAGGKLSPGFQEAIHACGRLFVAEVRASTLSSLSNDG